MGDFALAYKDKPLWHSKTVLTGLLGIAGAVVGLLTNTLTPPAAGQIILNSLLGIFVRSAIKDATK